MRYLLLMMLATVLVCGGCSKSSSGSDGGTDGGIECILGTYIGNFNITTQARVAALAGYTSLSENLTIECESCTDLSELSCLTSVGGDLSIGGNDVLTNLDGLSALTSVGGGHLIVINNPIITNLNGLSGITSVGENLSIYYNYVLPNCEACDLLDQLTSAPTSINVHDNLDDTCTPVPANCP
jgi:hypothetical protein